MSTDREPTLRVVSKPDPDTMRLLAHEIAVKIESATERPARAVVTDRTTQATGGSATITPSHIATAQAILKEVGNGPDPRSAVVGADAARQPGDLPRRPGADKHLQSARSEPGIELRPGSKHRRLAAAI